MFHQTKMVNLFILFFPMLGNHVDIPLTPNENIEMGGKMKKQMDDDPKKLEDPRTKPGPDAALWPKFKWAVMYPLYTISHYTIPGRFSI